MKIYHLGYTFIQTYFRILVSSKKKVHVDAQYLEADDLWIVTTSCPNASVHYNSGNSQLS